MKARAPGRSPESRGRSVRVPGRSPVPGATGTTPASAFRSVAVVCLPCALPSGDLRQVHLTRLISAGVRFRARVAYTQVACNSTDRASPISPPSGSA
jgi:hypothetical protein